MSRGKLLSLEEARNGNKPGESIAQFAKEHPSKADRRFWAALEAAAKGVPATAGTSTQAVSEDCSETQTHPDTSEGDGG